MKIIYILILLSICITSYSQTTRQPRNKVKPTKSLKNNTHQHAVQPVKPRVTATEKYLNGTTGKSSNADTGALKSTGDKSPFEGGVHAVANAGEKFDTVNANVLNAGKTTVTPVAASSDTVFNANTINSNGVTTNSGAVDRSGQSQFGQTNWGNNRSTVGESQWTIPPPVTASFNSEFPAAGNLTWTRSNTDTSIYSARYKSGDTWVTTNYSVAGKRLDMRTEVPLALLPQPVSTYISKLPNDLQVSEVSRWQVLGKQDVYEIKTRTGKIFHVNKEGTDLKY